MIRAWPGDLTDVQAAEESGSQDSQSGSEFDYNDVDYRMDGGVEDSDCDCDKNDEEVKPLRIRVNNCMQESPPTAKFATLQAWAEDNGESLCGKCDLALARGLRVKHDNQQDLGNRQKAKKVDRLIWRRDRKWGSN
ncbi:MAG: hypothetical protein M1836_006083 [Candelina mexicana]|nr:MAG: hypothetical protein M1836_006083 [Candelina mexicana]